MKVRQGQTVPISIRVEGSTDVTWNLMLSGPTGKPMLLAEGATNIRNQAVAQVAASDLAAGELYQLTLSVADASGDAVATAQVIVPDLRYTLIPVRDGDPRRRGYGIYAVDGEGDQVLYSSGKGDPAPVTIIHRDTGRRETLLLRLGSTTGVKFSGDGTRLFYEGSFPHHVFGLGYMDLATHSETPIVEAASFYFTVDRSGARMAYRAGRSGGDYYFLFDEASQTHRQLTHDPDAIKSTRDCPAQVGTTPLISADGSTVVMITPSTLGVAPEDPTIGCRIFAYDVANESLAYIVGLPAAWRKVDIPALSDDGRWLSFIVLQPNANGTYRGVSVLVDVTTGMVSAPVVDVGGYTTFDATVTGDGNGVIISTQADLDPRVGNADHNLELFHYNRTTGEIRQISETVGGVGSTPGGCSSERVSVSRHGGVLAYSFAAISTGGCSLDGPQRTESNGVWLNMTRAVRKRPGNIEVVFDPVENPRVVAGEPLTIVFTAHDEDGDGISFFAQAKDDVEIPPGSSFTDHFDGTATFEWTPRLEEVGEHILRVAAFDEGGGERFRDVAISVVPVAPSACSGNCNGDDRVTIDELLLLVNIALNADPLDQCTAGDSDANGMISIDEILLAVTGALDGCPSL